MTRTRLGLMSLLVLTTLSSGCARLDAFETNHSTYMVACDELRKDLPSWHKNDTPRTLETGERFVRTFKAVCGLPKSKAR
jgi:hypothetical protein